MIEAFLNAQLYVLQDCKSILNYRLIKTHQKLCIFTVTDSVSI